MQVPKVNFLHMANESMNGQQQSWLGTAYCHHAAIMDHEHWAALPKVENFKAASLLWWWQSSWLGLTDTTFSGLQYVWIVHMDGLTSEGSWKSKNTKLWKFFFTKCKAKW